MSSVSLFNTCKHFMITQLPILGAVKVFAKNFSPQMKKEELILNFRSESCFGFIKSVTSFRANIRRHFLSFFIHSNLNISSRKSRQFLLHFINQFLSFFRVCSKECLNYLLNGDEQWQLSISYFEKLLDTFVSSIFFNLFISF